MITHLYGICLLISAGIFIYMVQRNHKTMDTYYWTIIMLIPVVILGYWLKTQALTREAVEMLFCFIYLDSTFMIMALLFCMLHNIGIPVHPWMKIAGYGLCVIHIAIVALSVHTDLYYTSIDIRITDAGNVTKMTGGPLRIFHYAFLGAVVVWFIGMIIYGIRKNGTYSRRSLVYFGSFLGVGMLTHFLEELAGNDFTILPALYVIGEIIIAVDYGFLHAHDISFVVADLQGISDSQGYVSISLSRSFLGCNEKAKDFLGFLREQRVDEVISGEDDEHKTWILNLVDEFEQTKSKKHSDYFKVGDITCACEVTPFSAHEGGKPIGYLLSLRDATEERKNYEIIQDYNETLNIQIQEKTQNIQDIQRKIVLGMANMIENRDNNTGGHVKRTSDIIRYITDEIRRQGHLDVSEEFSRDIVRAAPTHDLGKISIDSNILNKPGRLTPEEFEIMKTHSTKSGEMVKILLEGVEEERFVKVAYNVARYHHERWDGRGYPEGLTGTMIPLEARIMAVADVYDALVSRRCYKAPMSFEKAAEIMCENMGTQFDPNMEQVFLGCREQLEEYYRQHDEG